MTQEAHTIDPVIDADEVAVDRRSPVDESRDLAVSIADVIADTPAADTLVLDIHELSSFADYFVICSGENERQLRAIADTIAEKLAERGTRPGRSEGTPAAGWVVLDYGDVIVHVFDVDQRDFYRLESLWSEAPTLLAIQ
jgi:ribosome-associated protein